MHLFIGNYLNDSECQLSDQEYHHCIRVTRHKLYDKILVTDFAGSIFLAAIKQIEADYLIAQLLQIYKEEMTQTGLIHIAMSPLAETDRFEWFVEKAVEMGVHQIQPIICQRTEKLKIKTERLEKIILNACKQNLRALKPILKETMELKEFVRDHPFKQGFIAHCENEAKEYLADIYNKDLDLVVLIGPTGDFTMNEINYCQENGFKAISLGDFRLRTETAGLVAIQIVQTIKQKSK